MTDLFELKAPGIMRDLIKDLGIGIYDAAAIVGNAGHECNGFKSLQEIKPTVAGSRGGYGWFQWTGKRRVDFEEFCKKKNLQPQSDAANYGYLLVELRGAYKYALAAIYKVVSLKDKVETFEANFEYAGVKHYPSRLDYALRALKAYRMTENQSPYTPASVPPISSPLPPDIPKPEIKVEPKPGFWKRFWQSLFGGKNGK